MDTTSFTIGLRDGYNANFHLASEDTHHLTLAALRRGVMELCALYLREGEREREAASASGAGGESQSPPQATCSDNCEASAAESMATTTTVGSSSSSNSSSRGRGCREIFACGLLDLSALAAAVYSNDYPGHAFLATLTSPNSGPIRNPNPGPSASLSLGGFGLEEADAPRFVLGQNAHLAHSHADVWLPLAADGHTLARLLRSAPRSWVRMLPAGVPPGVWEEAEVSASTNSTAAGEPPYGRVSSSADSEADSEAETEPELSFGGGLGRNKAFHLLLLPDAQRPDPVLQCTFAATRTRMDAASQPYTVYCMRLRQGTLEWGVEKRYREFIALHDALTAQAKEGTDSDSIPPHALPALTGKQRIRRLLLLGYAGSKEKVERGRVQRLSEYVSALLDVSLLQLCRPNVLLLSFLGALSQSRAVVDAEADVDAEELGEGACTDGSGGGSMAYSSHSTPLLAGARGTRTAGQSTPVKVKAAGGSTSISVNAHTPTTTTADYPSSHEEAGRSSLSDSSTSRKKRSSHAHTPHTSARSCVALSSLAHLAKPGDVLLFRCSSTAAALQRAATGKEFDHTALVVHTPLPRYIGGAYAAEIEAMRERENGVGGEGIGDGASEARSLLAAQRQSSPGLLSAGYADGVHGPRCVSPSQSPSRMNNAGRGGAKGRDNGKCGGRGRGEGAVDYERIARKLDRYSLCLLEATQAGVTVLPMQERLRAYEHFKCCEYVCLRRLAKTDEHGHTSMGEDIFAPRTLFRLNSFVVAAELCPYKFTLSTILLASKQRKARHQSREKGESKGSSSSSSSSSSSRRRSATASATTDEEGWSVFSGQSTGTGLLANSSSGREEEGGKAEKETEEEGEDEEGEPEVPLLSSKSGSQKSFFCSALTAAALQVLHVLPTTFNDDYFWPGSFASGGELDEILASPPPTPSPPSPADGDRGRSRARARAQSGAGTSTSTSMGVLSPDDPHRGLTGGSRFSLGQEIYIECRVLELDAATERAADEAVWAATPTGPPLNAGVAGRDSASTILRLPRTTDSFPDSDAKTEPGAGVRTMTEQERRAAALQRPGETFAPTLV